MSLYEKKSRYVRHASIVEITDDQGRKVKRVGRAKRPPLTELGEHIRREGQRLDHLANYYLRDTTGYWKIFKVFGGFRISPGSWKIIIRNDSIVAQSGCYPNC